MESYGSYGAMVIMGDIHKNNWNCTCKDGTALWCTKHRMAAAQKFSGGLLPKLLGTKEIGLLGICKLVYKSNNYGL